MTFLHLSLLAGGLLALAPIALHMLGRRQPKALTFPAIRFVRQTAVQAEKGWSIRRWLLLAMRVLLLLLAAVALASPRVPSADFANYLLVGMLGLMALLATGVTATAIATKKGRTTTLIAAGAAVLLWVVSGLWGIATATGSTQNVLANSGGPIAAAMIFDTSPSMGYLNNSRTRLDEAKTMATWLMDRMPMGSQIAIVNSDTNVRLLTDRASANRQMDRTSLQGRAALLTQRVSNAIDTLRASDLERREIYILTDLSTTAWKDADTSGLMQKLAKNPDGTGVLGENVLVQIIDVSVPPAGKKNWGIGKVTLSQQSAVPGSSVSVEVEVTSFPGSGVEQMTVELQAEPADQNLVVRGESIVAPERQTVDKQLVEVPDGGTVQVRLNWKGIGEGINNAQVRLSRPDPLEIDNVHFLSVEGKAQGDSLVVANDPRDAQLVALAIEPPETANITEASNAPMAVTNAPRTENYAKLGVVRLEDYSNVVLYDPYDLDADTADKISRWVQDGGGLLIVLGSSYRSAEEISNAPISTLLPGTVKRITRRDRSDRGVILSPAVFNHPAWGIFERPIDEIPWAVYPVFRHWDIEDLNSNAYPLMRFTQSQLPAITEEARGKGRILTWAVPYPEPYGHEAGEEWSELYSTTSADWPGFALFTGCARYLASWSNEQLNYFIEQPAALSNPPSMPSRYQLFEPNGEQTSVDAGGETLVYNYTQTPGTYRLKGLRPQGPVYRGFSVNIQPDDVSLNTLPPEALRNALGDGNYRTAKEQSDVESSVGEGRYGRELGPYILVIVVMLFMAEQTMASRFYASTQKRSGRPTLKTRRRGVA